MEKRNDHVSASAATSTRSAALEPEPEEGMTCDYAPCTCADAFLESDGEVFCSESCADLASEAHAREDAENLEIAATEEESCLCGHAECAAVITAGAGAEKETGRGPRPSPGRK